LTLHTDTSGITMYIHKRCIQMTPCGHTYCEKCLSEWLNTNKICPTCKQACLPADLKRNLMVIMDCGDTSSKHKIYIMTYNLCARTYDRFHCVNDFYSSNYLPLPQNIKIESVVEALQAASVQADLHMIESVFHSKSIVTSTTQSVREGPSSGETSTTTQLLPSTMRSIQETFAAHLTKVYKEFSDHEKFLESNYRKESKPHLLLLESYSLQQTKKGNYNAAAAAVSVNDSNESQQELTKLRVRYEEAMKHLNEDLDSFLSKTCAVPSLLPSTVMVVVRRYFNEARKDNDDVGGDDGSGSDNNSNKADVDQQHRDQQSVELKALPDVQFNVRLYNTTVASEVIDMAQQYCLSHHTSKPDSAFSPMMLDASINISLRRRKINTTQDMTSKIVFDSTFPPIHINQNNNNSNQPLFRYSAKNRLDSAYSDVILIEGMVETKNLKCFAVRFQSTSSSTQSVADTESVVAGGGGGGEKERDENTTTDYYRCETCSLNWICSECSKCCHEGHQLSVYMMNHSPSWNCCYCYKKKSKTHCKLV